MNDPAARPWWADVQHLRPDADREREQRSRETRDAALGDVRAQADASPQRPRGRFARAAEALGTVATLDRTAPPTEGSRDVPATTGWGRDSPDLSPAAPGAPATDAWWLDEDPAPRRELRLVVEEPVDTPPASPRRDRVSTEDWLALTEPFEERRDPDTGRKVVEIRGEADGTRGVAAPDPAPTARAAATSPRARRERTRATAIDRMYGRPDRIAMWAFVLGMVLILVALLGTPQASASAATRLGDRALKAGMEGRDVRHLQLRLKRAGFLDAPATARFGALTRRAVKRYQRSRCLKADGVAGPSTIRALRTQRRACRRAGRSAQSASPARSRGRASRKAYRSVDLGARTLAKGMRGRDVRTLQTLLGLGADGVFGNQTRRAVKRFQRHAGLTADGAVGPATRRTLAARRCACARPPGTAPASTATGPPAGRSSPAACTAWRTRRCPAAPACCSPTAGASSPRGSSTAARTPTARCSTSPRRPPAASVLSSTDLLRARY
jgi:peptidoglycan hydrolase-like protein with peptidoglycan-binding domain